MKCLMLKLQVQFGLGVWNIEKLFFQQRHSVASIESKGLFHHLGN